MNAIRGQRVDTMISKKKLSVGLLGCGDVANHYAEIIRHETNSFELSSVWDHDTEKMKLFSEKFGIKKSLAFDKFLEEDFSLICICTPNHTHADLTKVCLNSGFNVLTEHPLATTVSDAKEISQLASQSFCHVFVMRQRRYLNSVQFLKFVLKDRLLGKVNEVSANMLWNRSEYYYINKPWQSQKASGGVVLNQFSHFLDIMLYLFGDALEVSGILGNLRHQIPVEDTAKGVISFFSGVKADFFCTTAAPEGMNSSSLIVKGDKGFVRLSGKAWEKIEEFDGNSLPDASFWGVSPKAGDHADYLCRVHNKLLGNDVEVVDASEGIRAVILIEMIYKNLNNIERNLSNYIGDSLTW